MRSVGKVVRIIQSRAEKREAEFIVSMISARVSSDVRRACGPAIQRAPTEIVAAPKVDGFDTGFIRLAGIAR
jgi:hypothetical protein